MGHNDGGDRVRRICIVTVCMAFFALNAFAEATVRNDVLLAQGAGSYQQVRHIVIRGTNEEIGRALAGIARQEYGVTGLAQYPDALYARAADSYLRANYPALQERAKGVAAAFGEEYATSLSVFDQLVYDAGPWNGCSSAYYPPARTETGGGLLGHNMDYQLCSLGTLLRMPAEGEPHMFTRNYVIELYPDKGYASIGVGTGDLLSVVTGMNEKGLVAVLHTDNYTLINTDPKADISGLVYPTQIVRCVLDTCATVDEAKVVILNNKISLTFEPAHLLIADASGRSVSVEINPKNARVEFTDGDGVPRVFTNHPIYRFPDPAAFPAYTPYQKDDSFARYNDLTALVAQKDKAAVDDVFANQLRIAARWNNPARGLHVPIPNRTIWTDVYDQKSGTLRVRFYLKDGPLDPESQDPKDPKELVFSGPFTFTLKR